MSLSDLQTAQVKLTYFGPQNATVPSVGLSVSAFNLAVFVPFRRAGFDYSNEEFAPIQTGLVSAQDLKSIIDGVATLPNVTAGGVAANPFVSFALSNTAGGAKVFEALLSNVDAAALFDKLRAALLLNSNGLLAVSTMACPLGLLDTTVPSDVTSSSTVVFSGFRLNRSTGRYVGTATVTNNSASMFPGPVSLVVQFAGNLKLMNPSGATCGTSPVGILFVNVTPNALAGGASATVNLDLANPNNDPIQPFLKKVLVGPGTR